MFNYVSSPSTRGTLDILWSSLFTVIACTWTLQHPNVPEQRGNRDAGRLKNDKWISVQWRNAKWGLKSFYGSALRMFWTIIAPELIMMMACGELLEARQDTKLMKKYADDDDVTWTLSHSYFANMGGFAIKSKSSKNDYHDPYHLNSSGIYRLRELGYISKLPDITEEEIHDKSKGDLFVKLIAVGQIVWSIIQITVRAARRLSVSPLEVAVVAFATSAVIIYGLWWKKPQRVSVTHTIRLQKPAISQGQTVLDNEAVPDNEAMTENDATPKNEVMKENEALMENEAIPDNVLTELEKAQRISRFFLPDPLPGSPINVDTRKHLDGSGDVIFGTVMTLGATLFGGIHVAAWNFTFPSRVDLILWRCASIYTAAVPIGGMALAMIGSIVREIAQMLMGSDSVTLFDTLLEVMLWIDVFFAVFYIPARLCILVEMFRTLCFLPPGSYISTWTSNIPHVA